MEEKRFEGGRGIEAGGGMKWKGRGRK